MGVMTSTILVTGGTGTLGRRLVPLLSAAGHHTRVLSRHGSPAHPNPDVEYVTGDLAEGTGLQAAVEGADTILHLGGSAKGDDVKTRNLVRAAAASGSPHLVYISVVGADRVRVRSAIDRGAFGYYAAKLASEGIVESSGLPWTTLRATQFHDSMFALFDSMARGPIIPVFQGVRFQPVDTGEVAERLVELAHGEPAGLVPDLAGPRAYGMDELARNFLQATGRRRPVLRIPLPGDAARSVREGANLSLDPPTGRRTWEDALAERVGAHSTRR